MPCGAPDCAKAHSPFDSKETCRTQKCGRTLRFTGCIEKVDPATRMPHVARVYHSCPSCDSSQGFALPAGTIMDTVQSAPV
jgi:hypothetical protein